MQRSWIMILKAKHILLRMMINGEKETRTKSESDRSELRAGI